MNKLTIQEQTELRDIVQKIFENMADTYKVCARFVAILDSNRDLTLEFMIHDGISSPMLEIMENVGRKRWHPQLMFMPGPGAEALQKGIPLKEQERILRVGVEVATPDGKSVIRQLTDLTAAEASLAIGPLGQISLEQQHQRLKSKIINKVFKPEPFQLDGDRLLALEKGRSLEFERLEHFYFAARKAHEDKLRRLESDIKRRQIQKN